MRFTFGAIFLKSFATAFLRRVVQAEQLLGDQIACSLDAEHIGAGVANRPDFAAVGPSCLWGGGAINRGVGPAARFA
jgi:hypothetical protein